MKRPYIIAAAVALLSAVPTVSAQPEHLYNGYTLTVREELGAVNLMTNDMLFPPSTEFTHVFGTEVSAGYRYVFDKRITFGLSAGLMLYDYSRTHVFDGTPETLETGNSGNTALHRVSYDGKAVLSLPLVADAKLRFVDLADRYSWEVVPLLSARVGYVLGLTRIKGVEHHEYHFVTATPPNDRVEHTEYSFRGHGLHYAIGAGFSFRRFDVELEYGSQPTSTWGRTTKSYCEIGSSEPEVEKSRKSLVYNPHRNVFTLRLTYNF